MTRPATDLKVGHYKTWTEKRKAHVPVIWHVGFEAETSKKSLGSRAPLARCEQPTATAGCRGTTTDLARVTHVFRGYAALTTVSMRAALQILDALDWGFGYMG
jgi:hypothetical protein